MTYTGSLNVVIYGGMTQTNYSSPVNHWITQTTPKFKVGDRIVYYDYLLRTKKLAIHKIIGVTNSAYIIKYQYPGRDTFKISFTQQDDYMEFDECSDKHPDLFLSAKINGPNKNIWNDED